MNTVLITGATGALGQAVLEYLSNKGGYQVVTTSRSGEGADFSLDITDKALLSKIIELVKPDLVLQLAATFTHDFEVAYAINVEANRQLLETALRLNTGMRVLLVGSAAEYGILQPDENPVSEDHSLNPVSVYGLTKAWQSQLACLYSQRGVDVVVARVFNLKGANLSDKLFVGRLQKQIDKVLAGEQSIIELGPLSATRDYVSLEDAAQQIFSIAEHGDSGQVYHVASGKPVVMRDLLVHTLEENNLDVSVVKEATEKSGHVGYDVPVIYADMRRASRVTGIKF